MLFYSKYGGDVDTRVFHSPRKYPGYKVSLGVKGLGYFLELNIRAEKWSL
jgi:hypothetical protein